MIVEDRPDNFAVTAIETKLRGYAPKSVGTDGAGSRGSAGLSARRK